MVRPSARLLVTTALVVLISVQLNEGAFSVRKAVSTLEGRLTSALKSRTFTRRKPGPSGSIIREVVKSEELHDLFFLVDESGSIGASNFDIIKKFMRTLIENVIIGPNLHHGAIVTFGTNAEINLNYATHAKSHCHFLQAITNLPYTRGWTNTKAGFTLIKKVIKQSFNKRRYGKKIVFYLTDGNWNKGGDPAQIINQVKNLKGDETTEGEDQVTVFSFGIGNVKKAHLIEASSLGYYQAIPNFEVFNKVVKAFSLRMKGLSSRVKGQVVSHIPEQPDGVSPSDCGSRCSSCVCKIKTGKFNCKRQKFRFPPIHRRPIWGKFPARLREGIRTRAGRLPAIHARIAKK